MWVVFFKQATFWASLSFFFHYIKDGNTTPQTLSSAYSNHLLHSKISTPTAEKSGGINGILSLIGGFYMSVLFYFSLKPTLPSLPMYTKLCPGMYFSGMSNIHMIPKKAFGFPKGFSYPLSTLMLRLRLKPRCSFLLGYSNNISLKRISVLNASKWYSPYTLPGNTYLLHCPMMTRSQRRVEL